MISIFLIKTDESTGLLHDKNYLNSVVFQNMASLGQASPSTSENAQELEGTRQVGQDDGVGGVK